MNAQQECVRAVMVNSEGHLGPGFRKKDVTREDYKVSESFFRPLPWVFLRAKAFYFDQIQCIDFFKKLLMDYVMSEKPLIYFRSQRFSPTLSF